MIDKTENLEAAESGERRCPRPVLALLEATAANPAGDADASVIQALSTVAILETMCGSARPRLGVRQASRAVH